MSVFYKLDKRVVKGFDNQKINVVYARAYHPSETHIDQLSLMISRISAVSMGDVKSVLNTMSMLVSQELQAGRIVDLGDLGRLRVGLRSKASATEEEFSVHNIRSAHTIYTPGKEIRRAMRHANFRAYVHWGNAEYNKEGSDTSIPKPNEGGSSSGEGNNI